MMVFAFSAVAALASPSEERHIIPLCASVTSDANYPLPLIGEDPKIIRLRELIALVAPEDIPVLIIGETGTGKEVVARAIQDGSRRKGKAFVTRNMSAIPEALIESELFGHEKGAFTGAAAHKKGIFEQANGGTIFLDEIGEMPLAQQVKLLRVLENGDIDVVGGTSKKVDFRLIAATNANLESDVRAKKFRSDLYYRLNVITLEIPPLRHRKGDILILANHFLGVEAEKRKSLVPKRLSASVRQIFLQYSWEGNVRELAGVIQGAYIYAGDLPEILEVHLPERLRRIPEIPATDEGDDSSTPPKLEMVLKRHVLDILSQTRWNKSKACEILDMQRSTLNRWLKEWGMERPSNANPELIDP